jgi:hypothetical protein
VGFADMPPGTHIRVRLTQHERDGYLFHGCPELTGTARWNSQATDILIIVLAFFVLEIVLSRLLYRLHIRNRPL